MKPGFHNEALQLFEGTGVVVKSDGCRYLGSPIGSPAFMESYVSGKVRDWQEQVERLSVIADSQPQSAYAALVHGLQCK